MMFYLVITFRENLSLDRSLYIGASTCYKWILLWILLQISSHALQIDMLQM